MAQEAWRFVSSPSEIFRTSLRSSIPVSPPVVWSSIVSQRLAPLPQICSSASLSKSGREKHKRYPLLSGSSGVSVEGADRVVGQVHRTLRDPGYTAEAGDSLCLAQSRHTAGAPLIGAGQWPLLPCPGCGRLSSQVPRACFFLLRASVLQSACVGVFSTSGWSCFPFSSCSPSDITFSRSVF